jgi:hypothetical protein
VDTPQTPPQFVEWTDQIMALLQAEPFDAFTAQAIGDGLAHLAAAHPHDLAITQDVLCQQLCEALSPEHSARLRPRLLVLLGEMAAGFFSQQTDECKRLRLDNLRTLGHELRSPINAISGFSRVILKGIDGPITDMQKQDLTAIHNAGQNLLALIDNVLDIAKGDAGKTQPFAGSFDVAALIGDMVTLVQPVMGKYNCMLRVHCAGELGAMRVNLVQLRWVLANLLVNAAKFVQRTEQGAVTLEVTREAIDENAARIIFRISDNGGGLPPEKAKNLFIKPEQRDTLFKRDYWASDDLGLIATYRICQRMGGDIAVESEMGKGTTFIVRLPAELLESKGRG